MPKSKQKQESGGVRLVPGLAVRAGQTLAGRYRVEQLLGSGASGVVLAARSVSLRERVTLKILAAYTEGQRDLIQRRLEKARLAMRLRGVHVARILDIGATEDGMPYVATEALDGRSLDAELLERGQLPVEEAARWVLEACEGLAEAHALGLVHGDLKPQNLFLATPKAVRHGRPHVAASTERDGVARGEDTRVLKVLDFGTTSPLDAIGDQSASAFFGSPAFLAPEQIQDPRALDARADVWALGVLLYELISGELPFEAETLSGVMVAVVYDAPALLTDAPYELARVVHRCLDKDPAGRPQNVEEELAHALAPFAGAGGARQSERVRATLEAPPSPEPAPSRAGAGEGRAERPSGSIAPVSVSVRRSSASETTRPSRRVEARRRARMRTLSLLGAAAAIALWVLESPSLDTTRDAELMAGVAPLEAVEVPPFLPAIAASELEPLDLSCAETLDERISAPVFSFSPRASALAPITPAPAPLAPLTPADLPSPATAPAPAHGARPTGARAPSTRSRRWGARSPSILPAPRRPAPRAAPARTPAPRAHAHGGTARPHLPAGLPASRDGAERARRKLFSDRK